MRYFQDNRNENLGFNTDVKVVSTNDAPSSIVSLNEAKLYMSVTNTQEDVMITSMITNAILQAENYLNRDILGKTREMYLVEVCEPINLYYPPIEAVNSVSVDGRTLTLETEYEVLGLDNPAIRFINGNAEKVLINYTTKGISDQSVRQGILALTSWLYDRGDNGSRTNWKSFLSPFKTFGYYGTN